METTYQVSKPTAALFSCVEEFMTLRTHLTDALRQTFYEEQIESGAVGKELFATLSKAETELLTIIGNVISDNLLESKDKDIKKI